MPISAGLIIMLSLLLAADAWTLAQRPPGRDPMLAWGRQRHGLPATLAARAALILLLAMAARLIAGPPGNWLVLALCAGAATIVWLRLRKLARDKI